MRVGEMQWCAGMLGLFLFAAACDEKSSAEPDSNDSSGSSARSSRRSSTSSSSTSSDKDDQDAGSSSKSSTGKLAVSIEFAARVGSEDFACGEEYKKVGSSKTTVTPRDLRLFVQDVQLIDEDGAAVDLELDVRKPWQSANVALLDFEDGSGECGEGTSAMNAKLTGHVPNGTYTGIRFTNGVPENLNHKDPVEQMDPLKTSADLSWGWLTGFRFTKIEMAQVGPSAEGIGMIHIGSTGCSGNALAGSVKCSKPNRNTVELSDFDPEKNTVVLDVAAIFEDTDLTQTAECHGSGEACAPMFEAFGVDLKNGKALKDQSVYSVE